MSQLYIISREKFMSRLIVLLALLFTTLVAKQETFSFIGVSISTETINLENRAKYMNNVGGIWQDSEGNSKSLPNIDADSTFSLRYGQQTTDYRTIFAVTGNSTFQTVSIEVDKILMDDMFGFPEVRPYIGGVIGYMHYKGDIKPKEDDDADDNKTTPTTSTTTVTTTRNPDTNETTTNEVTVTTPIKVTETAEDAKINIDAPFLESNDGFYYGANFGFLIYGTDNLDLDVSYHYYKVEGIEPIDVMQGFTFGINYFY